MESIKPYTAINASAGSGKTYALVQRILTICLRYPNQHDAIRHILALTFTNKAANEMKERILQWLKDFTQPNFANNENLKNIQIELAKQGFRIDIKELHNRSQKVLDYILHNYSTLNIGTIDKFNSRLVRSFSNELGLPHQFNLEIQSEPYLIEAVDKMLDQIGEDNKISGAFMDFVNYNLDNDERVNINNSLYKKAKQFVSDVHYEELQNNAGFNWESYDKIEKQLKAEIQQHRNEAKKTAEQTEQLLKDRNLEITDFSGGNTNSIAKFFSEYLKFINKQRDKFPFPANETSALANFEKGASSSGKHKSLEIEYVLGTLIQNRENIIKNYIEAEKKDKILRELLPLKINKEIQEKLTEIEEENDLVLLSKFNILINENLKNEPSDFIYEKIGTRYFHYFFDEFQDTSKMQWENILPLKEHTINSEASSFTLVGDPKQSIYRFRGGDSELMLNILNGKEKSNIPVSVETLHNNWRSAQNIVNFNNELYEFIARNLNEEHQILFSEKAKQVPQQKMTGRVKIGLTDYSKGIDPFFENVAEQMHRNIQECVNNGFKLSDITILCRTGHEIQKYSQLLGLKKINYSEKESFIKTISEKGLILELSNTLKAVVELLKWQIQPKNKQYLVRMLYFLNDLGRITMPDFSVETSQILQLNNKTEIENYIFQHFGVNLNPKDEPRLNLYNYIEFFVQEFSVSNKETDYLLNFLEMLYNFSQKNGATLKDFIKFWNEDGHKISIQASENTDAINMMTIHAAKGLEFPIVFLPMQNSNSDGKFNQWFELSDFEELKSVNLTGFGKEIANYDQNLFDFNQENTYKNTVDRFCIQYVATTRAVEQLFLYLQKPSKTNNYLEIYDFINTKNTENLDEFDIYPEVDHSFKKQKNTEKEEMKKLEIQNLSEKKEKKNNIKIATPSKNYQNTVEKVRTGIFTHEILSKISTEKDLEKVLQQYILEGQITQTEKEEISQKISLILNNERYTKYFIEGLKIINEKDIMISSETLTEIYRPDRLIETAEGFYIIDFKTGAEKEKHEHQVETYKNVLNQLGKNVIGTEIIYI